MIYRIQTRDSSYVIDDVVETWVRTPGPNANTTRTNEGKFLGWEREPVIGERFIMEVESLPGTPSGMTRILISTPVVNISMEAVLPA